MSTSKGGIVRQFVLAITTIGLLTVGMAGAQDPTGTAGSSPVPAASAALIDAKGGEIGEARLEQTPNGTLLKLELRNVAPGVHALHIHEVGRCEGPEFTSAGDHLAPGGRQHGFLNSKGPHAGDLPNIDVPKTGQLSVEYLLTDVNLGSGPGALLDSDGSAIVIHASKDDYRSDPAGNAGDRIACGPIRR